MKKHRVKPSSAPMTSIKVNGVQFHYFHSEVLGRCRAILINPDENLAFSPTAAKAEKSHVELIFEEIDLYEAESAKKAENPQKNTLSKGQQLECFMECANRLADRVDRYMQNYFSASDYESKRYWWDKLLLAEKAKARVNRKIGQLSED
jgi:hypothetical protein